jgi:glycosyltransferase involved in cell wall biosynthesis
MPTALHALAHDEAPFWLSIFDEVLTLPVAIAYNSEEERSLITRRAGRELPGSVIGVGSDLSLGGRAGRFRSRFGLGDRPYLLYVGRVDPAKGSVELHRQFLAFKERHRGGAVGDLALVIVREQVSAVESHPDVVLTGYLDEQSKADAMSGCLALAVPSYFESFSMVLTEAWVQSRPALVQGHSEVLLGHARRSGGAIPYFGFAEFEVGLEALLEDPGLASRLGTAGRRYVEENYTWDLVIDRYERLLRTAAGSFRARLRRQLAAR